MFLCSPKQYWVPSFSVALFKQTQADSNAIELLFQSFLMVWSFVFVSLFCELGEMISEEYEEIDQRLFECNWHKFPIEMQRMFVIATVNFQQPVYIRGYGDILCTRETLKKVSFRCEFGTLELIH